jgi:hypothetical protein
MSKVEEVARAIYVGRNGCGCKAWAHLPKTHQEPYLSDARAAIEAMREPTPEMVRAIRPQEYTIEHYHGSGHHRSFPTLGSGPVQVWQDMIDASLREEGR